MQLVIYACLGTGPILLLLTASYRASVYHQLRSSQPHLVLARTANHLRLIDISLVILLLVVENIKSLIGLGPRKLQKRHESPTSKRRAPSARDGIEFPDVSVTMKLEVPAKDIKQYQAAIAAGHDSQTLRSNGDASLVSENNAHLAIFLMAISGPAVILLLARPICPINPLGAVNVRNLIRIREPGMCKQLVREMLINQEHVGEARLTVKAKPMPEARRVKRGREVDIRAVITLHKNHHDSSGIEIFEQIFTVLEFGKSKSPASESARSAQPRTSNTHRTSSSLVDVPRKELKEVPRLASYFKIKPGDPMQWARLCKDYNPIHTSSIAAKMFGFRSTIAHGNHAVAKAVEILSEARDLEFSRFCQQNDDQTLWMQIEFKRPILLPSEVGVRTADRLIAVGKSLEQYTAFEIFKGDKVHAEVAVGCCVR